MKVILEFDYKKYVLDAKVAFTVMEILVNAEQYEEVYVSASKSPTGESQNNHHVYVPELRSRMNIYPITDTLYQMAKLAGAPTK